MNYDIWIRRYTATAVSEMKQSGIELRMAEYMANYM
ncbi:hypothetical protein DORLON_00720 [Dorea longicatena DSM 13814]|uniref:Uncharacterized protein n=1 Tax=Dorea longicatena DSM 13814 TaxID=411462 RepID=A6BEK2_9FIRM|nr:hypothetical protein DORLON_00720 [Dorea longicatena DSM 13814]